MHNNELKTLPCWTCIDFNWLRKRHVLQIYNTITSIWSLIIKMPLLFISWQWRDFRHTETFAAVCCNQIWQISRQNCDASLFYTLNHSSLPFLNRCWTEEKWEEHCRLRKSLFFLLSYQMTAMKSQKKSYFILHALDVILSVSLSQVFFYWMTPNQSIKCKLLSESFCVRFGKCFTPQRWISIRTSGWLLRFFLLQCNLFVESKWYSRRKSVANGISHLNKMIRKKATIFIWIFFALLFRFSQRCVSFIGVSRTSGEHFRTATTHLIVLVLITSTPIFRGAIVILNTKNLQNEAH